MEPDGELLRRYAETGDEAAFAELVRRQLGLVYGAALRQVGGDAHRAQEVAQAVFSDLARKAGSLAGRPVLASWLHTSTRFAATKLRRAEVRRWKHEQEAGAVKAMLDEGAVAAEWDRLRPVIDEAVQALGERDREAVLQRFFANRAFGEIGDALGVSEDAARMRVERALEKLRGLLARRGVTSTAAALGLVLESHASTAVPAGMASAVAGKAVASGAGAAGAATLAETLGFMSTMKLAGGVAVGLLLMAALGTGVYSVRAYAAAEAGLTAEMRAGEAVTAELRAVRERALATERGVADLKRKLEAERAAKATTEVKSVAAVQAKPAERFVDARTAGDAFMVKHPVVKTALVDYARARMRFRYAELYAKLALSPEQIARFEEVAFSQGMGSNGPDGQEMHLVWWPDARNGDIDRQLNELLGAEGMKLYREIAGRDESRNMAVHVAGALWFSDTPLTPTQADRLIEVFQSSQARSGPNTRATLDWGTAITRAAEFLSAPQLAVLEAEQAHDEAEVALNRPMSSLAKKTPAK